MSRFAARLLVPILTGACFPGRRYHKKDLLWYLRQVEEVVIRVLAEYGVEGCRDEEYSGVWVKERGAYEKVAFVGVNVSRWITMHGFSINVQNTSALTEGFGKIVPCGIEEIHEGKYGATTLDKYAPGVTVDEVRQTTVKRFAEVLGVEMLPCPAAD